MRAPTTATPTSLRTRVVTFRIDDLPALAARGVWMSVDQRNAINTLRIPIDPDAWEAMALGRDGRTTALTFVIERRLEAILNPTRRAGTAVRVEDFDPDGEIPQPPARHGGAPGVPAQGEIRWGSQRAGAVYVRETDDADGGRP